MRATGCAIASSARRCGSGSACRLRDVLDVVEHAELQLMFRGFLFTRIVPVLRDIGLWGPRIRAAFDDMGVLAYAEADLDELVSEDEAFAEELDRQRLAAVRDVAEAAEASN